MNNCATPSSISWLMPFSSCFVFMGSAFSMYLNISGEKEGRPRKCSCSPSVSVSPILKMPLSGKPTMSPAQASSMVSLRWAMNCVGLEKRTVLPLRMCRYGALRTNFPEQTLQKAMQERWLGSMLAVILKMKPVNFFSSGVTSRSSAITGRGAGAILQKQSSSSCTPKLVSAEPKKTGASMASLYSSSSKAGYTPSIISRSSRSFSASVSPTHWFSSSLFMSTCTFSVTFCLLAWKRFRFCSYMLYTPLKR